MQRRRAYAYTRVSKVGERGDDLISPELQLNHIQRWAERNDVDIVEVVTDLDESGRRFEKRKVQYMIDGIAADNADIVILWKWSRWGRNLEKSQLYLGAIERVGGEVRAAEEDFDPRTTTGKFTRDQMLLIAEFLSNQIGDSWKDTHDRRRRLGLPHTAIPRFGYTCSRQAGYVVDEELRPVLANAYRRIAAGTPLRTIATEWNDSGLTTLNGNRWNVSNLGRMLDTGFAAGLIRERSKPPSSSNNKKTLASFDVWREGVHEAIIDEPTWKGYHALRVANAHRHSGRAISPGHALTGLVRCALCDKRMQSAFSGRYHKHVWVCPEARDYKTHPFVSASNAKLLEITRTWLDGLTNGRSDDLRGLLRDEKSTRVIVPNVDRLQAEVDRLLQKRKRLANTWTDGLIEREDYEEQREEVRKVLAMAEDNLAEARRFQRATPPTREQIVPVTEALAQALDKAKASEIREMLVPLIARIEIQPGGWTSGDKAFVVPTWAA